MSRDVPHIDLRDYRGNDQAKRDAFVKTLGEGLEKFGFLTVEGHEIKQDVIDGTYSAFKRFFALDEETKKQYDKVPGGARGYTPFGREHAKDSPHPDLKEFWHVGQELPEGHAYSDDYPANIWPTEEPLVKEYSLAMYRALERCATTILEALADFYDLPKHTFADMMVDGDSILRSIHYPPLGEDVKPGSIRAAAHEDINLITLLCESHGQGLELLTHEGNWLPVDALAGDIVVDSGDMLSRVTNGVIPATTHRVANPEGSKQLDSRYSLPFFVHPYAKCDLSVMDRFITPEQPAKFEPITARGFLEQRLREIGLK